MWRRRFKKGEDPSRGTVKSSRRYIDSSRSYIPGTQWVRHLWWSQNLMWVFLQESWTDPRRVASQAGRRWRWREREVAGATRWRRWRSLRQPPNCAMRSSICHIIIFTKLLFYNLRAINPDFWLRSKERVAFIIFSQPNDIALNLN